MPVSASPAAAACKQEGQHLCYKWEVKRKASDICTDTQQCGTKATMNIDTPADAKQGSDSTVQQRLRYHTKVSWQFLRFDQRLTCSWLAEASSEAEEHCPGEQVDASCDPRQKISSCVGHRNAMAPMRCCNQA